MMKKAAQTSYATSSSVLLISERQRGNPLIRHIKNVRYEYSRDTVADYAMTSTCVVFVSVKYHTLHNSYALARVREVGKGYRVRVLLVYVDDDNSTLVSQALLDLNKLCFTQDFTLILSWSDLECARYLETLKEYEGKSASSIQEKVETEYIPRVTKLLSTVKSVNKTDVTTLLDSFGSLGRVFTATEQQLLLCPGLGEKKVRRLHQVLNEPFQKRQRLKNEKDASKDEGSILGSAKLTSLTDINVSAGTDQV
jgi:DNA excision repair protein ERCC-1